MEDKLILLVEDNPHIMAINDAALHMRGDRTLQAETAHKCRELLCFHAVDLIVLDILLPDGDGVALCREIKQEYDVPILFLTAMGENEDIVKGLTAGDFDGDGKDTLMVYTPGNNKDTDTVDSIKEYTFSGGKLTDKGRVINLGDVIDGGRDALKAMLYHDGNGNNELRAHLSVDMEVGDVDMDGIDELAMTVNVNDLKEKKYGNYTNYEKSYLTVYDYNDKNSWNQKLNEKLLNKDGGASGRARFAGVTIGYVSDKPSGSMPPEVVAVGYYDKKDNYQDCEFDKSRLLAYSYQYSTKDNLWTEKFKATEVVTNGFTDTGTKGDDVQNPIAVAAVAADGVNTKEYLFIWGCGQNLGPYGYPANKFDVRIPLDCLYSRGLIPPRESLIRFSQYQCRY